MQLSQQPPQRERANVNTITQLRHKLANALIGNTLPTLEDWETPPQTPYPLILRTGLTTITDENDEQTTYPEATTIIQEHPHTPTYTATITHNGEIIGWHQNPTNITTE